MKQRLIVWMVRFFAILPLIVLQTLGWVVGRLFYWVPNKQKAYAQVNLALCFADMDEQERDKRLKASLVESARLMFEMPRNWFLPTEKSIRQLDINQYDEKIMAGLSAGKGLIIAIPHLGNWEAGSQFLSGIIPVSYLYRPSRQAVLQHFMEQGRSRGGAKLIPITGQGMRALYGALKAGEAIVVLPDQQPKQTSASNGVFAPFFGQPALTMTLVNRLAKKTGAPVLFTVVERLPFAKGYKLHVVDCPEGVASNDPIVAASALNQGVQDCVSVCPDQYQWSYKRFDAQPDGQVSPYAKIR